MFYILFIVISFGELYFKRRRNRKYRNKRIYQGRDKKYLNYTKSLEKILNGKVVKNWDFQI